MFRLISQSLTKPHLRSFHSICVNGISIYKDNNRIHYEQITNGKQEIKCSYIKVDDTHQKEPKFPPFYEDFPRGSHNLKVTSEKYINVDNDLYVLDGRYQEYDEKGKPWRDVQYSKGLIDGYFKGFLGGEQVFEVNCKQGVPHGFYKDRETEMYFSEGLREGLCKYYDSFGVLKTETYYEKGREKWYCKHYMPGRYAELRFPDGTEIKLSNYDDNLIKLATELYDSK